MDRRIFLQAFAVMLLAPRWAGAAGGLRAGPPGKAVEVIDGDTLRLEDGREVRLVGIQAPKLPLGRRNFPTWPLADDAKAALERIALGKRLVPVFGGADGDRHGRVLAHLHVETADGPWLQGEMLRRGLARVYTFSDNRARAGELYALEREARDARRAIWRHPFYRVRDALDDVKDLAQSEGTFQLVEGRVADVGEAQGRSYLNFGANWRDDFTVTVPSRARAAFRAGGADLRSLAGTRVRVRGWLKWINGPSIDIDHPEPLEVLT
jgi:endonuclease YncB( thermonuclease family)